MKRCPRCGELKSTGDFNRNRANHDGLQTCCRACQVERNAESVQRRPEVRRATQQRRYQREIATSGYRDTKRSSWHQKRAHRKLDEAIANGQIERPTNCPECGSSDSPIHAHHEDYDRPLDVRWLCARCHVRVHRDKGVAA